MSPISLNNSVSESTIYDRAVHSKGSAKRGSSSSDDFIDTSDEIMDISTQIDHNLSLIADSVCGRKRDDRGERDKYYKSRPQPGGSGRQQSRPEQERCEQETSPGIAQTI